MKVKVGGLEFEVSDKSDLRMLIDAFGNPSPILDVDKKLKTDVKKSDKRKIRYVSHNRWSKRDIDIVRHSSIKRAKRLMGKRHSLGSIYITRMRIKRGEI